MFWITVFILSAGLLAGGCGAVSEGSAAEPVKNQEKNTVAVNDPAKKWRKIDLAAYPNADTIILDEIEEVVYNPDGTYIRSDESWTLIKTDQGRREMRSLALHYNEFYNLPPEIELEVIRPDGRVIKPLLQKKISTESSDMQQNIYDPANKILSAGIPDLAIGDIVHCKWQRKTIRPRMQNVWCDMTILQSTAPVLRYKYVISAPEKSPLALAVVKDEVKNTLRKTQEKRGDRIFYTFEAKNVPQVLPEPDMPPWYLHSMRVLCSTAKDWQSISRWYYELCEPHLQAVSPELTAKAKSLADNKTPAAAVRALFDFVSKEIRYTGITNENTAPGYEPHDVKDTFAQRHGVCRDKAALLAAMLREAGFEAFTVLFMAGDPKDLEVPNNYFNHAVTGVKMPDGKLVLMDPTDENSTDLLPGYAMDKSFLCATKNGDTLRRTPVIPPEKNMLEIRSQAVIDQKYQLTFKSKLTFRGVNDNIYRGAFASWDVDYRRQFITATLKRSLPGAENVQIKILPEDIRDLARPLQIELECRVPEYVNINWAAGALQMPLLSDSFGAINFMLSDSLLDRRKYPLQLEFTAGADEQCLLELPDTLKIAALPEYKNVDTRFLYNQIRVSSKENTVRAEKLLKLRQVHIPAADYQLFRKNLQDVSVAERSKVIVRRSFEANSAVLAAAPAVLEDSKIEVVFGEKGELTVDCQQSCKIQTYSGIKDNSELKIPFVAGISEGRFISGSVTSPDGKVTAVDPSSGKLMDDGVSASAPRYPTGKVLVVPLPGVQVNSVIKTHWQIKTLPADNADFYYALWRDLPVRNSVVEFRYPARLQKKLQSVLPEAGFRIEKNISGKIHSVKVFSQDIPQMPQEPATPPVWTFAPYVGMSLFNPENYCKRVLDAIKKAASNAPESRELALKLTGNIADTAGKVRVIRDYVAKNIRAAGHELDVLGIKYITPADTVLRENYGNSVDRAVLLYAMLQSIGIKNTEVVLMSELYDLPEFSGQYKKLMRNIFSAVMLVVNDGERELFLNCSDEYSPLEYCSYSNMIGLNTLNGELVVYTSAPDCESMIRNDWHVRLLPGGKAEFSRNISYYGGAYAARNRFFANITPDAERQFWEQQFSGLLTGAENKECSRDFNLYPGLVKLKFTVPDFWKQSGSFCYFTLPDSGSAGLIRTAGIRTLPCLVSGGAVRQERFTVEYPENWQYCQLNGSSCNFNLSGRDKRVSQSVALANGVLELDFYFGLNGTLYVPVQGYSMLEAMQKFLSNPANRTFLFKTTGN